MQQNLNKEKNGEINILRVINIKVLCEIKSENKLFYEILFYTLIYQNI